jgi:hypothetical protein
VSEPFDLDKHRAEQDRARALGLGYAVLRDIILQAHWEADDGISMGRAVELIREMGLRAVDKAVAEERAAVVTYLRAGTAECRYCLDAAVIGFAEHVERGEHRRKEGA